MEARKTQTVSQGKTPIHLHVYSTIISTIHEQSCKHYMLLATCMVTHKTRAACKPEHGSWGTPPCSVGPGSPLHTLQAASWTPLSSVPRLSVQPPTTTQHRWDMSAQSKQYQTELITCTVHIEIHVGILFREIVCISQRCKNSMGMVKHENVPTAARSTHRPQVNVNLDIQLLIMTTNYLTILISILK